jgi:hypothetical protein
MCSIYSEGRGRSRGIENNSQRYEGMTGIILSPRLHYQLDRGWLLPQRHPDHQLLENAVGLPVAGSPTCSILLASTAKFDLAPALNQANTDFARLGPANFADGFDAMQPGPNPREISNIVVASDPDTFIEQSGHRFA